MHTARTAVSGRIDKDQVHIPALDGLRGLAVLLVIVFHLVLDYPFETGTDSLYYRLGGLGWIGVDLFFVLSGFLITGILLDSKCSGSFFRSFYARRMLRIFPLYYAVLIFIFVLMPSFGAFNTPELQFIQEHQVYFWTYMANWGFVAANGARFFNADWLAIVHFWSLAVEEQFYLLWPFLVYFCERRRFVGICLLLIAGALLCRLAIAGLGLPQGAAYTLTPCRIDGLAFGGLIAVAVRDPRAKPILYSAAPWAFGFAILAMSIVFTNRNGIWFGDRWMHTIGFSVLALGWGGLLVMCLPDYSGQAMRSLFEFQGLRTLGFYSYGLYVLHHLILPQLHPDWFALLPIPETAAATLYIAFCTVSFFAAAWLSWHLLEKHFMKLKKFFRYNRTIPEVEMRGVHSVASPPDIVPVSVEGRLR